MKSSAVFRILILTIVFSVIFVISGCASTYSSGRDFSFDDVRTIKTGSSTKDQVLAKLGPPESRQVLQNGRESWFYNYGKSTTNMLFPLSRKSENKSLIVTFFNDVVKLCQISFTEQKSGIGSRPLLPSSVPCDQAP